MNDWGLLWALPGWLLLAGFIASGVGRWLKSRAADYESVEDFNEYRRSLAPRSIP